MQSTILRSAALLAASTVFAAAAWAADAPKAAATSTATATTAHPAVTKGVADECKDVKATTAKPENKGETGGNTSSVKVPPKPKCPDPTGVAKKVGAPQ